MKKKIAVVHGRFQPLHLGHLDNYLMLAWDKCDFLIVGVTNPDPTTSVPDDVNPSRTRLRNNPLNFFDRYTIIENALLSRGLKSNEFRIVPFPINIPESIKYYVPKEAKHYLTIFDAWGRKKMGTLISMGFDAEELECESKAISATIVREAIIDDSHWEKYVHESTVEILFDLKLKETLMKLR